MANPETRPKYFPRILHIDEVGSTNVEAMRLAMFGETGPVWIRAIRQTEGKGRSGRQWMSESGNLFASLLMRLTAPAPKAYQLSLVTGVAVIEAVREAVQFASNTEIRLKWPNDLLINGAKAGGILVESSIVPDTDQSPGGLAAVVGIGLNLVSHPDDLGRPVTHLEAHGDVPPAHILLENIGASLNHWTGVWAEGDGFPAVREAWLQSAHPIGERMSVNAGNSPVEGGFAGIDAEGALLLDVANHGQQRFTFGDVSLSG
jgi:BirA family biotin operon repressor/biotin-[acetyl-CoA-carboxylase] ligase